MRQPPLGPEKFLPQPMNRLIARQVPRLREHLTRPPKERQALVLFSQLAEQNAHCLGLAAGFSNGPERGRSGELAGLHFLQKPAFKGPAARGTIRIDAAQAAIVSRARLRETQDLAAPFQREAELR